MHWLCDFSLFSETVGVGDAGIPETGFYQLVLTVVLLLVVGILHRRVSPPPAPSASRSDPRGVVGRGTSFVGDAGGGAVVRGQGGASVRPERRRRSRTAGGGRRVVRAEAIERAGQLGRRLGMAVPVTTSATVLAAFAIVVVIVVRATPG